MLAWLIYKQRKQMLAWLIICYVCLFVVVIGHGFLKCGCSCVTDFFSPRSLTWLFPKLQTCYWFTHLEKQHATPRACADVQGRWWSGWGLGGMWKKKKDWINSRKNTFAKIIHGDLQQVDCVDILICTQYSSKQTHTHTHTHTHKESVYECLGVCVCACI